jgi:GTP cyclohydrolase I
MINEKKLEKACELILEAIGENKNREGLKNTPIRFSKAFKELLSGYNNTPNITTFDSEGFNELIFVKDINFSSFCEHHLLPFYGTVHVGYIPDKKIIGLSKIPRIIEIFSKKLQNQERLTMNILNILKTKLKPRGIGVVVESSHMCMTLRGVKKNNSKMKTLYFDGILKENKNLRSEFLGNI